MDLASPQDEGQPHNMHGPSSYISVLLRQRHSTMDSNSNIGRLANSLVDIDYFLRSYDGTIRAPTNLLTDDMIEDSAWTHRSKTASNMENINLTVF